MPDDNKPRKRDKLKDWFNSRLHRGHREHSVPNSPSTSSPINSSNNLTPILSLPGRTKSETNDHGSLNSAAGIIHLNRTVSNPSRKDDATREDMLDNPSGPPSTSSAPHDPTNRPSTPTSPARSVPSGAPSNDPGPPLSTPASSTKGKPKPTVFQKYPKMTSFLNGALEVAGVAVEASPIPGLSAIVVTMQKLIEFGEKVGEHREQIYQLGEEVADYVNGLHNIMNSRPSGSSGTKIDGIFDELVTELQGELAKATETMNELTAGDPSFFVELWNVTDIGAKIEERTKALQKSRETFTVLNSALTGVGNQHILIGNERILDGNERILQMISDIFMILHQQEHAKPKWKTSRLPYITAAYDQDATVRYCLDKTRAAILDDLYVRLSSVSEQGARIIWLRALAGSGKSTIAKTVAKHLKQKGRLAGSFFFSRNISGRSEIANFFATLANQLAARNTEFAAALIEAMDADPGLKYAEPTKQLEELLIKPLNTISSSTPFVFVVDALDECGKDQGNSFLKLLLPYIPQFPSSVCFFFTSRPERPIIGHLSSSHQLPIQTINIDEKSHEVTSREDIYLFISVELHKVGDLDVKEHEISVLVKLADGLFQFAATAVRLIMDSRYQTPRETLDSILALNGNSSVNLSQRVALDNLYETIFKQAYPRLELVPRSEVTSYNEMMRRYHLTVGGVVHAQEPVSMTMLAALVGLPVDKVKSALERLSSVLLLPDDLHTPIRIRHLTFTEYITDPNTDGPLHKYNSKLVIDNRVHGEIAQRTLPIAATQLQFNISEFESSFVPNSAESLSRAKEVIPPDLAYACRFWGYHLEHTPREAVLDLSLVRTFMEKKLLFWFEALSALGAVNVARAALVSLDKRLESVDSDKNVPPAKTKSFVKDAIKFIEYFAPVIAQSPPHTYISTFPFAPTSSSVAKHYRPLFRDIPMIEIGQLPNWPLREHVFHGHSDYVNSVAFSPDGKLIASGSNDSTIRIWDVETGQTVAGPLEGHSGSVRSVAFSPDGKHVVSGSDDSTIRIWDAEKGLTVAGPFEGHSNYILSVAFSPDGQRVVSGSNDNTIRIWDVGTGQTVAVPFEGHSERISSVAFSPDGSRIVSGSWDDTIRIWDVETSQTVVGPLQDDSGDFNAVAFSPDGKLIVSGSDDFKIRIWDAETGQIVAGPLEGHSGWVRSVAFSPDGKRVVSGSNDSTIRIWDAETGLTVAGPFDDHSSAIYSVAFSPDGQRIVSGSGDNTIRMWDAETDQTVAGLFEGHSELISSVAFSPDGNRIVSGSWDDTIRIWDVETGLTVVGPLQDDSGDFNAVAFSPDGKLIVSGSDDYTIRIWDAETGQIVAGPLEGHSGWVRSVAFSPDGKRVVSGSNDCTIRIWDAETGLTIAGPFDGHSTYILSVAFSPDGQRVVSGSGDNTIRIWDVGTGQTVADPFEGHSNYICSVAFSPDGSRIASGSYDHTIRIWNVETGQTVVGPFKGHSSAVLSVAFSPDGQRVVSGSSDHTIRIWDAATGQTVAGPFNGHLSSVHSVAFSPDGSRIVSGSENKTIRILDPNGSSHWESFEDQIVLGHSGLEGWVKGINEELLLWIPPLHRVSFHLIPSTVRAFGHHETRVDCNNVVWGKEWTCIATPELLSL